MYNKVLSWLQTTARKPGGLVMALLIAAALVSPVIMLMANAEHKAVTTGTSAESAGVVYYVTPSGTGDGSGSSWTNAMSSADFAEKMGTLGSTDKLLAKSTAKTGAASDTSLDVTFYLKKGQYDLTRTLPLTKGVKVYGGFDGTETAPGQRDITAIMSGDNAMSADHATILSRDASVSDDVHFSIVTGGAGATSADTVLDGVTVTGGKNGSGGAMYNYGSPTVTNCTFSGNTANDWGGAMYNVGSPTVANCTFSGNTANDGGAMYNAGNATIINCTFSNNTANGGGSGGAMYNNGSPTVTNCTFSGNSANGSCGGAMVNGSGRPILTNCTFSGNSANGSNSIGGAIYNHGTSPIVTNCTFSGNSAIGDGSTGGAMGSAGNISSPVVCNSIFWNNSAVSGNTAVPNDIYHIADSTYVLDIRHSVAAAITYKNENTVISTDVVSSDPKLIALDRSMNVLDANADPAAVYIYAISSDSSAENLGLPVGSTVSGDVTIPSDDQTGLTRLTAVSTDAGAYALNVKDLGTLTAGIDPSAVTLAKGASADLTLSANISQRLFAMPGAVKWTSSAADIAGVAGSGMSAVVTAVKKGAADITAAFTIKTGTRMLNGTPKTELTGTATSVVTVTEDEPVSPDVPVSPDKPVHKGGSGCNAGTAGSGIALLALCLPMLIKRRKH